jgi:hypothetical protein
MTTVQPPRRWWRALFIRGAAIALTLSVAIGCGSPTGPPNTPNPDETEKGPEPKDPEGQGFLVLPSESQGFLV